LAQDVKTDLENVENNVKKLDQAVKKEVAADSHHPIGVRDFKFDQSVNKEVARIAEIATIRLA
jgi:hypothetical protein